MNTTPAEQRQRDSFFDRIKDEIKGLYKFVRERLAYHEAIGELNPGDVAAEDIAGTVLLRAYREYAKQSASERSKEARARVRGPWLQELATKQIQWTVDRLQAARSRGIALQKDIPETPPEEEISTLGEEVLYFVYMSLVCFILASIFAFLAKRTLRSSSVSLSNHKRESHEEVHERSNLPAAR